MVKQSRCKICSRIFTVTDERQYACSDKCQKILEESLSSGTGKAAKCLNCGKSFIKVHRKNVYCSAECRKAHILEQRREARKQNAAPVKPTVEAKCEFCGNTFMHTGKRIPKYCSTKCRQAAYREERRTAKSLVDKGINPSHNIQHKVAADIEMARWNAARQARKKWVRVPLEEAAAICKKYNLTYPQYQYMKAEGTLQDYINKHKDKE